MASDFKSYEEWMGALSEPQGTPSGTTYDLTGQPAAPTSQPAQAEASETPQTAQATAAPAPSFQAPQVGQPLSQAPASTTPGAIPQINLSSFSRPSSSSQFLSGLFDPLGGKVEESQRKLQEATAAFTSAAGPYRDFDFAGGAGTLDRALQTGAEEDVEAARNLVGARYTGPGSLDQRAVDDLTVSLAELEPRGRTLRSFGGAEDLLKGKTAGLTAGQRRMETQRLLRNPEYTTQAKAYESAIRDLFSDYSRSQEEARGIAEARRGQESSIARLAREDLEGRRAAITGGIDERLGADVAKDRALQEAYDRFTQSGSLQDLAALDQLTELDLSGYDTGLRRQDEAGEALRAEILAKPEYAAIKDVPLLTLGITGKGREALFLPPEYVQELKAQGKSKKEINTITQLARKRQHELERHFSAGTAKRAAAQQDPTRAFKANREAGEHGFLNPLYFAEEGREFEPQDIRPFVDFDVGAPGSRESMASAEEREDYNLIQDILGQADRLEETSPRVAAQVRSELERYLAEEKKAAEDLRGEVEGGQKEWRGHVSRQRRRYKKAKRAALLGKIGAIVGAVIGTPFGGIGSPAGHALGGYLGKEIGEEIA